MKLILKTLDGHHAFSWADAVPLNQMLESGISDVTANAVRELA